MKGSPLSRSAGVAVERQAVIHHPRTRAGDAGVAESRAISSSSGSATVEQTGLVLLLGSVLALLVGFGLLSEDAGPGRGLGNRIADRIACGPREPDACRHHPAVEAYGWPVARVLRHLAPTPMARPNASGIPLLPVDFRYCRQPSCALPAVGERGRSLTASNRRVTAFTEVEDRRRSRGGLILTWWLYRPGLGWEALRRTVGPAEMEAASGTRLLLSDNPRLVPLETLDGRNHIRFPATEQPPWQWKVGSIHDGRAR